MKEAKEKTLDKCYAKAESSENNYLKFQESRLIKHSVFSISELLNTGLGSQSLGICINLIETGVHPQALSEVICKIREKLDNVNSDAPHKDNHS